MAKKNEKRKKVTLICSECKRENYRVFKNIQNTPEKLKLNKYCKHCQKTVEHKEKK